MTDSGSDLDTSTTRLSIIVPLYNEEDNVGLLYQQIVDALRSWSGSYEMIFVDDGSTDATFTVARRLAEHDRRLKLVRLRRNYGQTPAMAAGFDHASGDILVTMDGDLQNDPRDIFTLVDEIARGADIAVGWRFNRQDKLLSRKIPSTLANWLIGKVTGVPVRDNGCSLKAYRAGVMRHLPFYSDMHRFIPAITSLAGAKIAEVKVRHHARRFGQSKYGLSRTYKVLLDLLAIKTVVSFAARPLQWFSLLATPFILCSVAFVVMTAWTSAVEPDASLIMSSGLALVTAATGGFLMVCGILGEVVFSTGTARPAAFLRLTLPPLLRRSPAP